MCLVSGCSYGWLPTFKAEILAGGLRHGVTVGCNATHGQITPAQHGVNLDSCPPTTKKIRVAYGRYYLCLHLGWKLLLPVTDPARP